MIEDQMKY